MYRSPAESECGYHTHLLSMSTLTHQSLRITDSAGRYRAASYHRSHWPKKVSTCEDPRIGRVLANPVNWSAICGCRYIVCLGELVRLCRPSFIVRGRSYFPILIAELDSKELLVF